MNNSTKTTGNITPAYFLSGSYADLLRWTGLSQLQFGLLAVAIFLVISFIYLLFKLGMLKGIKFT